MFLKMGAKKEVKMSVTDLLWKSSMTGRLAVICFDCFACFFNMLKSPCVSVSLLGILVCQLILLKGTVILTCLGECVCTCSCF